MPQKLQLSSIVLIIALMLLGESHLIAQHVNDCCCGNLTFGSMPVIVHTNCQPDHLGYPITVYATDGFSYPQPFDVVTPSTFTSVYLAKNNCYNDCIKCHGKGRQAYCASCCNGNPPSCATCEGLGIVYLSNAILATTSPCYRRCLEYHGQINQKYCAQCCTTGTCAYSQPMIVYPDIPQGSLNDVGR